MIKINFKLLQIIITMSESTTLMYQYLIIIFDKLNIKFKICKISINSIDVFTKVAIKKNDFL